MLVRIATALAAATAVLGLPAAASASGINHSAAVPTRDPVTRTLSEMTLAQKVGQLFMVGTPADGSGGSVLDAITDQHVGNVILTGRSHAGIATTRALTDALQAEVTADSTGGAGLFVAADQEGGQVQVLQDGGFSAMPTALEQGGQSVTVLRSSARTWGAQLAAAGVNVDLGPVLDTVASTQTDNPPIGGYDREFGHTPSVVSAHGRAVDAGLAASGVDATVKHFPGLGRVTANTDTISGVTDSTTTRHDADVTPFADAVHAGVPMLMMSTAIYSRIDPGTPAVFSGTVVTGMVRGDLGFRGVIVSDDLSAARQVSAYSPAERALRFVQAGGDLILLIDTSNLSVMYSAVLDRARHDPAFAAKVTASVRRIVTAKHRLGLVG